MDYTTLLQGTGMGASAGTILALGAIAFLIIIALYVYNALSWYSIGKKLKYKYPWIAWIPVANISMMLQLGGFHWAWVFLILIPIAGWIALAIMTIIATWRIFEKRNYPGWLSLVILLTMIPFVGNIAGIAYLVILGLVAWRDN